MQGKIFNIILLQTFLCVLCEYKHSHRNIKFLFIIRIQHKHKWKQALSSVFNSCIWKFMCFYVTHLHTHIHSAMLKSFEPCTFIIMNNNNTLLRAKHQKIQFSFYYCITPYLMPVRINILWAQKGILLQQQQGIYWRANCDTSYFLRCLCCWLLMFVILRRLLRHVNEGFTSVCNVAFYHDTVVPWIVQ